jgi:hypothetical protein
MSHNLADGEQDAVENIGLMKAEAITGRGKLCNFTHCDLHINKKYSTSDNK